MHFVQKIVFILVAFIITLAFFPAASYAENIIGLSPSEVVVTLLPNTSSSQAAYISYTKEVATNTFAVEMDIPDECHCSIIGDSSFSFGDSLEHTYVFTVYTEESAAPGTYQAVVNFVPQADENKPDAGVATLFGIAMKVQVVITDDPYAVMAPTNAQDVSNLSQYLTIDANPFPVLFVAPDATVNMHWQVHSEYPGILQALPYHVNTTHSGKQIFRNDGAFSGTLLHGATADYTIQYSVPHTQGVYSVTSDVYGVRTHVWVIALTLPTKIALIFAFLLIVTGVVMLFAKRHAHH